MTRSRKGTRSERAMGRVKLKQKAAEEEPVTMKGDGTEEEEIGYVAEFKYFLFRCDGDRWAHVEQRMSKATAVFGSLFVPNDQMRSFICH